MSFTQKHIGVTCLSLRSWACTGLSLRAHRCYVSLESSWAVQTNNASNIAGYALLSSFPGASQPSQVRGHGVAAFCTLLSQQALGFKEVGLQGGQAATQGGYRGVSLLYTGFHPCLHLLEAVHAALLLRLDLRSCICTSRSAQQGKRRTR